MLLLVVADRNVGCPVKQNVGCHERRIGEQAQRSIFAILAGLVLELRHAVHPADARHAVEDPCKLRVLRHAALVEDDMRLRIDAGCEIGCSDGTRLLLQIFMHQLGRQGVKVDHTVDAVMAFLQSDEFADRAQIVAQVKITGGLDTGKD